MSDDLAQRVEDLEQRVAALENPSRPPPKPTMAKDVSIREFIISKAPKTSVETTLLIAYHLEKSEGISSFNVDDLNRGFAQAREPRPSNPSDMLYKNAKRGFITEAREKKGGSKAYVVTNTGMRFVENGLKEA